MESIELLRCKNTKNMGRLGRSSIRPSLTAREPRLLGSFFDTQRSATLIALITCFGLPRRGQPQTRLLWQRGFFFGKLFGVATLVGFQ